MVLPKTTYNRPQFKVVQRSRTIMQRKSRRFLAADHREEPSDVHQMAARLGRPLPGGARVRLHVPVRRGRAVRRPDAAHLPAP